MVYPVIAVFRRLGQEYFQFEARLGYIARLAPKQNTQQP